MNDNNLNSVEFLAQEKQNDATNTAPKNNNMSDDFFDAAGKAVKFSVEIISGIVVSVSEMTKNIMQNQKKIRQGMTAALLAYVGIASIGKSDTLPYGFSTKLINEFAATADAIPVLNDVTDYGAKLINSAEEGQLLEKVADDAKNVPGVNRLTDYLLNTSQRAAEYRNGPTAEASEDILRSQSGLNQVDLTNEQIQQANSFESLMPDYNNSERSK